MSFSEALVCCCVVGTVEEVFLGLPSCLHLAHHYSSVQLYTPEYQARCRVSVGRNRMSWLYPKARMWESRGLVMFQPFRL